MIDFTDKAYRNILQAMLERIPDTYDKRDTAPIPTALGPAAYALEGFYLSLDQVQRMAFIQTAVGQPLDYLAALGGLTRYPASAAVRLGVFDAAVPIGSRFSTANGSGSINFTVTAAGEAAGQYRLTAETPGAVGNEYTGPILPITTLPGLASAQITEILVPGEDAETDGALRSRLMAALNERPFGGNIAAYRSAISAIEGVGAVQVYPTWDGGGTVKCSVLGADFLPASGLLVENVQNAVDPPPDQGLGMGMAPIGAKVTVTAPEAVTVAVSAAVRLAAGYSLDQVRPLAEEALEAYLLSVRRDWGEMTGAFAGGYAADVYISRVTAAIVGAAGIVNATDVRINGGTADLILTESGVTQQVPVLGTVTLYE